jgi:hypothetical protein
MIHLCCTAAMAGPELRMRRRGAGIIRFELAGTGPEAQAIMDAWGKTGRSAARASLLLDYCYLATYGPLLARACEVTGERLSECGIRPLGRIRRPVAGAQIAAALLDAVENTALLSVLDGRRGHRPMIARTSALAKFALLSIGGLYVVGGLVALLTATATSHSHALEHRGKRRVAVTGTARGPGGGPRRRRRRLGF